MLEPAQIDCPYCGEAYETFADLSEGSHDYIEDCPVCCRPWQVGAWLEGDGAWCAILRTADE